MRLHHDDLGADIDAAVEIDDVLVAHADAARGDVGADGPGFVGAVDTVKRRAEIHRARAERIFRAAFHVPGQVGTACDHFRRRGPGRPFALRRDRLHAGPGEAGAADADAVAHRPTVALDEIEKLVRRIDHDRAGTFIAAIVNELFLESRVELTLPRIDRLLLEACALRLRLAHRRQATLVIISWLLLIHRLLRSVGRTTTGSIAEDELDEAAAHVRIGGDAHRRRRHL